MLVLSNQRLGPAAEVLVSRQIGCALFVGVADAARPIASAYWERELVRWLQEQATRIESSTSPEIRIDVGDIAFTPNHFAYQRQFLLDAIRRTRCDHVRALARWADLIEAHPSDSVQFGRRFLWHSTA